MDKTNQTPNGILGIDAGGTFTDLAFLSGSELRLCAKAKTPTDHDNLIQTIRNGLDLILRDLETSQIRSVNLATTLATNAIVENKLRPVGLILIGYSQYIVEDAIAQGVFGTHRIRMVAGGHDPLGNEAEPLDEEALAEAIDSMKGEVDAIALSSYFSVRNTEHELRARAMVNERLPGVHVTCGHELASDLNAIKRATTTVLNAGLIPIVMGLLSSVEDVCKSKGIDAPITVVRGDGSLVGADWAQTHPVEMVLSGPAGSACGACFLAGADKVDKSSWVVDIGGTTTDIIRLDAKGKPVLLDEGATVGGHKTLVKAIDIYTFGLGGDSRVAYDSEYEMTLGPRRVRPLCVTISEQPELLELMQDRAKSGRTMEPLLVFPGKGNPNTMWEQKIMDKLKDGPVLIDPLLESLELPGLYRRELEQMEALGKVQFSGFTPTDALHVLGRLDKWDSEASKLGASMLLRSNLRAKSSSPEELAEEVIALAVRMMSTRLFHKSFSQMTLPLKEDGEGKRIIDLALSPQAGLGPRIQLELNAALVGVGAPTWAFIDKAGELLHEEAVLPEHADVGGAIGAAVGSFALHYVVRISPQNDGTYRVHHPLGVTDYDELEQALAETCNFMYPWVEERARKAGAVHPKVACERQDESVLLSNSSNEMYLWTQLTFTVEDEKTLD